MMQKWGGWKKKCRNNWMRNVWRRVYCRNQNYIFFIYGEPGSGKSEDGLALGEMFSPRFRIDHIVFNVLDFFNLITSDRVQQGDFVLFEEIGSEAGNRDYYTDKNKWMAKITQVIRTKNLIIAYTAPKLELADKQILGLCMGLVSTLGIDWETSEGMVRIYDPVSFDMKTGKWSKRLVAIKRRSMLNPKRFWRLKVGTTRIHRSSVKLRHLYTKARNAYTDKTALDGKRELTSLDQREKNGPQSRSISKEQIKAWAEKVVLNRSTYMDDRGFSLTQVQNDFECSKDVAKRVKQEARVRLVMAGFAVMWR